MSEHSFGVDISKDHLDVFCLTDGRSARFDNCRSGFVGLARWLGPPGSAARVVFEPTGPYHRAFEAAFATWPLVKINPLQARRFAQASGTRAKTDAIDARVLARMGVAMELVADQPVNEALRQIKELQVARAGLIQDRTAVRLRLDQVSVALLRKLGERRLRQIEHQIAAIDAEIAARLEADPALVQKRRILTSIPGLGTQTAAILIAQMPELGQICAKNAASLAGLAPMTQKSGKWQGKANIAGGRRALRRALYMPALSAIRANPDMKRTYKSLVAAGKLPKVALVAVMRKLIVLANTLLAENRCWVSKTT